MVATAYQWWEKALFVLGFVVLFLIWVRLTAIGYWDRWDRKK
jgi:hypothetical protein